jgi:superfamily II DNA/RNA helicase
LSTQSFADLGVSKPVVRALSERGLAAPFAVQTSAIPDVLFGRDVLVQSPTGSGKTLAFGVPMADRLEASDARCAALVLAPTRELASQIEEELRPLMAARSLSIAAVYGGAGVEKQAKRARHAHVLVATPGRLEDLIARGDVRLDRVRVLVLDEADRMLDMGFRPVVDRIVAQTPARRQTLFFSATLEGEAGRVAAAYTRDAARHEHAAPARARGKVEHRFRAVVHDGKIDSLMAELRAEGRGRTLIFVRTKRGVSRLVKRLGQHGVRAVEMHGNRSQSQRERALARFHSGAVDTLVATDVAARGIDVDDVTHVINFDAPEDRDAYVHRVGRTGRAGRAGVGITFVAADQAQDVGRIASDLSLGSEFAASGLGSAHQQRPRHTAGAQPRNRGPRRGSRRRHQPRG